jgi:hypothetical protein
MILENNDILSKDLNNEYKFDPKDENFSYIPITGTTFRRKTMLEKNFEIIPREFV